MRVDTVKEQKMEQKTMWNVTMLDCSGSMDEKPNWGDPHTKIEVAIEGIKADIRSMREDKTGVKFKVAIVEFEGNYSPMTDHYKYAVKPCNLEDVNYEGSNTGGATPLYAALGDVIDDIIKIKPKNEPCIISVFTDGGENSSNGSRYAVGSTLKNRIDSAEKENISVKFIGTQVDVENMIKNMGISKGNTYSHDNTMRGVENAFVATSMARSSYTASYAKGMSAEDLTSMDFFNQEPDKIKKDDQKK